MKEFLLEVFTGMVAGMACGAAYLAIAYFSL